MRGPWGADDATINGFDTWNGRIVATLATTPRVDSMAKTIEPLPATAQLIDTASAPLDDTLCVRGPIPAALQARMKVVRDSLERIPPELCADIYDRGVVLTGGGAMLRNLDKRLADETGLPVLVAENPLTSVVVGAGMILSDLPLLRKVVS